MFENICFFNQFLIDNYSTAVLEAAVVLNV